MAANSVKKVDQNEKIGTLSDSEIALAVSSTLTTTRSYLSSRSFVRMKVAALVAVVMLLKMNTTKMRVMVYR